MTDRFNLARFVEAQERVYALVIEELRRGRKSGHWIWYIFPQVAGLGFSSMSRRYSIASIDEAKTYLAHPVLGPRLAECVRTVLDHEGRTAAQIFGSLDAMKFRSCLTLFAEAGGGAVFEQGLDRYFNGERDPLTLDFLYEARE